MAKKLAFTLELEGSKKLITSLTQVELGLSDIGKSIRQAKKDIDIFNNGTDEQRKALEAQGKSLESVTASYKGYRDEQLRLQAEGNRLRTTLRQQAKDFDRIKEGIPDDSLIGLRREYEKLRREIDKMDASARKSVDGLKKIKDAESIKKQIDDIGESVGDFRSQVGSYKKALTDVLSTFGGSGNTLGAIVDPLSNIIGGALGGNPIGIINGLTTAFGPLGGAIAAAGGATLALGGYVIDLSREYERLNNQVGTLTGLLGEQLAQGVVGVKTLSEVFEQDFNEVLLAANTLTKEVTGDFNKSLDLIKTGFLAGANAQGQFLDNLREYSNDIRQSEIDSNKFLEALVRFEQEGLFNDKGIDLIKESGQRIREQVNSTGTSIEEAFGKAFRKELFDDINTGAITSFEGVQRVAKELQKGTITAKQYQQVIADVFGSQGEDANRGIEIISELTGEIDNLIDETDVYTQRQINLLNATEDLNASQIQLAAQFAGTGGSLDTLGIKFKAFGTQILNDFILLGRAIGENPLGLFGIGEDLDEIANNLEKADLTAFREGQKKDLEQSSAAFIDYVETVRTAGASITELEKIQAQLTKELKDGQLAGEVYELKLEQLADIKQQLSTRTKELNGNISKTKDNFKELAEGSIAQLTKQVSDLSKVFNETGDEGVLDKLVATEIDLDKAKADLEEYKEAVRLANIESLPVDEQVAILEERLEKQRQLEIQAANLRIEDAKELAQELSLINAEADVLSLTNSLKKFKEDSAEYIEILNSIDQKNKEIEDIQISIKIQQSEEDIQQATQIRERLLTEAFDDEQQLQARLDLLRTNSTIASINKRLELERLSNGERLELEKQLQEQIALQRSQQNRVDLDTDAQLDGVDETEFNRISQLVPELDPNNVEASLQALKDFEEQKKVIQLESTIQRFEIEKELLIANGESTLQVDQDIADKRLEIERVKNEALLKERQKQLKEQEKLQQIESKLITGIISDTSKVLSDAFAGNLETAEDAQNAFLGLMLDTLEKIILAQIAAATAQSFAQPDSVASFGISGAARAAILSALIKGAFSIAKNALIAEDGALLGEEFKNGGNVKNGTVFKGKRHSAGGEKFRTSAFGPIHEAEDGEAIIKRTSTRKWRGLLSAINEDTGGKRFGNSEKWKKVLAGIEGRKFRDGDITGVGPATINNIPQLSNPNVIVTTARIPVEDLEDMIGEIVTKQTEALQPTIDQIAEKVLIGMQQNNQLAERLGQAQQNAEL